MSFNLSITRLSLTLASSSLLSSGVSRNSPIVGLSGSSFSRFCVSESTFSRSLFDVFRFNSVVSEGGGVLMNFVGFKEVLGSCVSVSVSSSSSVSSSYEFVQRVFDSPVNLSDGGLDFKVRNCWFENVDGYCIYYIVPNGKISVVGCNLKGCRNGVVLHANNTIYERSCVDSSYGDRSNVFNMNSYGFGRVSMISAANVLVPRVSTGDDLASIMGFQTELKYYNTTNCRVSDSSSVMYYTIKDTHKSLFLYSNSCEGKRCFEVHVNAIGVTDISNFNIINHTSHIAAITIDTITVSLTNGCILSCTGEILTFISKSNITATNIFIDVSTTNPYLVYKQNPTLVEFAFQKTEFCQFTHKFSSIHGGKKISTYLYIAAFLSLLPGD